ncbi:IPT/TIG domain-containing protein [Patescibacteria group bacterium]|nr:IPT/TIG domain-containing protein [Patescibacteria group bacterium]MDE1946851.1 IPT/TIG domain-containing protein [Patescibacteria group bacterium]MDE2010671.1 IPT/TIG domain-containing protein [Patescibacteria group bacterium]MDE2232723.1 IPT/TIG domain-containing protein [Patescibacteria group bacterium]
MKKSLFSFVVPLAAVFAFAVTVFIPAPASAQTTPICPAGYTCTPINPQPMNCPAGYICTPTSLPAQTYCHTFNTNLGIGSSGDEVAALVKVLGMDGEALGVGGYYNQFNENVASAVSSFQEKYSSDILTPVGLTYGTGYVGASTRAKLNQLYGCVTTSNQSSHVISYLQAAAEDKNIMHAGEQTWIYGSGLSSAQYIMINGQSVPMLHSSDTSVSFYAPSSLQNGTASIYVGDQTLWTSNSITVQTVANAANSSCASGQTWNGTACVTTQPSITVLSPNGGQVFNSGGTLTVNWSANNIPAADYYLFVYLKTKPDQILGGTVSNTYIPLMFRIRNGTMLTSSYTTNITSPDTKGGGVSPGAYYIEVDAADENGNVYASGTSNGTITITPPTPVSAVSPSITSITPTSGVAGGKVQVTLYGTGFIQGTQVSFTGPVGPSATNTQVPASSISADGTSLTVAMPTTLTPGTYNVRVINTNGMSARAVFTVTQSPSTQTSSIMDALRAYCNSGGQYCDSSWR